MKEQTRRDIKYLTLAIIFATCLICSTLLIDSSKTTCELNCLSNDYTETFGINHGWCGFIIFSLLYLLSLYLFIYPEDTKSYKRIKSILEGGISFGAGIAIYFLYLQQFVLKEYCIYCLVVDVGILVCFGIIMLVRDKKVVTTLK